MQNINLFNNWTCCNINPCDWSNPKRWNNYLAIVSMNDDGIEQKEFCKESKESDTYFNVRGVNVGDILLASCWDSRKKRQYKRYYIVTDKTEKTLTLDDNEAYTTYRKTFKAKTTIMS